MSTTFKTHRKGSHIKLKWDNFVYTILPLNERLKYSDVLKHIIAFRQIKSKTPCIEILSPRLPIIEAVPKCKKKDVTPLTPLSVLQKFKGTMTKWRVRKQAFTIARKRQNNKK